MYYPDALNFGVMYTRHRVVCIEEHPQCAWTLGTEEHYGLSVDIVFTKVLLIFGALVWCALRGIRNVNGLLVQKNTMD